MFNQDRETSRSTANDIRVVLADDHQLFRQGLKALLELERGITVVGEASDGLEVQRISLEQNANVVLMDINMPIVDGLSATRELLRANGKIGVIILSMHHEEGHVFQALRAGARDVDEAEPALECARERGLGVLVEIDEPRERILARRQEAPTPRIRPISTRISYRTEPSVAGCIAS